MIDIFPENLDITYCHLSYLWRDLKLFGRPSDISPDWEPRFGKVVLAGHFGCCHFNWGQATERERKRRKVMTGSLDSLEGNSEDIPLIHERFVRNIDIRNMPASIMLEFYLVLPYPRAVHSFLHILHISLWHIMIVISYSLEGLVAREALRLLSEQHGWSQVVKVVKVVKVVSGEDDSYWILLNILTILHVMQWCLWSIPGS